MENIIWWDLLVIITQKATINQTKTLYISQINIWIYSFKWLLPYTIPPNISPICSKRLIASIRVYIPLYLNISCVRHVCACVVCVVYYLYYYCAFILHVWDKWQQQHTIQKGFYFRSYLHVKRVHVPRLIINQAK